MKKTLLMIVLVIFSLVSYLNAKDQKKDMEFTTIESVEILSRSEMGNGHWMDKKKVRCKLNLGGGWFTSSVQQYCILVDYMSNCMGTACGEPC